MGEFKSKKTAINITAIIVAIGGITAFIANIGQIKQNFFDKEESSSSSVVEPVPETNDSSSEVVTEPPTEIPTEAPTEPPTEAPTEPPTEEEPTEAPTEPTPAVPAVTYLDTLKIVDEHNLSEVDGSAEDTLGNKYAGHLLKIGWGGENDHGTYYLGGKYKTLSGTIAVDNYNTLDTLMRLTILADDNEIYRTEDLPRTTVPFEFSVNVEGCEWLRIESAELTGAWSVNQLILSEWKLEE